MLLIKTMLKYVEMYHALVKCVEWGHVLAERVETELHELKVKEGERLSKWF